MTASKNVIYYYHSNENNAQETSYFFLPSYIYTMSRGRVSRMLPHAVRPPLGLFHNRVSGSSRRSPSDYSVFFESSSWVTQPAKSHWDRSGDCAWAISSLDTTLTTRASLLFIGRSSKSSTNPHSLAHLYHVSKTARRCLSNSATMICTAKKCHKTCGQHLVST